MINEKISTTSNMRENFYSIFIIHLYVKTKMYMLFSALTTWAGNPSRGKTALRFVEFGVKINTNYYINKILKRFLSSNVPC